MPLTPVDVLAAIRTYLAGQATLTSILTNPAYIFGPPGLPDRVVSSMPCKCITYLQSGGVPHGFQIPLTSVRIEFRCYGASFIEAYTVERRLASVLDKQNNIAIGTNCLFSARKATEAQTLQEPDTGWPFLWIPYECTFSQVVT